MMANVNAMAHYRRIMAQQQHERQYGSSSASTSSSMDPAAYADSTEAIRYRLEDQRSKQAGIRPAPAATVTSATEGKPPNGEIEERLVLDNPLLQNNIIAAQNGNGDILQEEDACSKEEADIAERSEALEHGEKFLKWLDDYSDPAVTSSQVNAFETLLKNVKSGIEPK